MASDLIAGSSKFKTKCRKEEARLNMEPLAKKRKEEVEDKVKVEHIVKK